jgi:hypothetical protein
MTGGYAVKGHASMRYGFTMIAEIDSEGAWNSQVIDALRGDTIADCRQPIVERSLCRASR